MEIYRFSDRSKRKGWQSYFYEFFRTNENKDRVLSVEFALNELYNEKTEEYYGIKSRLTDTVIDAKL